MNTIVTAIGTFFMSIVLAVGGHTGMFQETRSAYMKEMYIEHFEEEMEEAGYDNVIVEWYVDDVVDIKFATSEYPNCTFVLRLQAEFESASNAYVLTETDEYMYREGHLVYWYEVVTDERYIDWGQAALVNWDMIVYTF